MADIPTEVPETTKIQDQNPLHLGLIIVFGIFASTLPQPQALGKLPLTYLLKNQVLLHDPHARTRISFFFLACGLFWYIKPLAGVLTDAFPIKGTRRRYYLLISSVCAGAAWLGYLFVPHTYNALLWMAIIVNLFMVMMSTVTGAYLVEAGQRMSATGRLTALRQVTYNATGFVNGFAGGFLAKLANHGGFRFTPISCAALVLSVFPIAYAFLREQRQRVSSRESLHAAAIQTGNVMRSRTLWFALLFVLLFYFAPGFGTVQFFRQTDQLHLDEEFIGRLGVYAGLAGVAAAFLYGMLVKRFSIRALIAFGVIVNALWTLAYLKYDSATLAIIIDTTNGFLFGLCEVAIIDLAARATPIGSEGLGYSLILSVRNAAAFGADYLGSRLADNHWSWNSLVILNASTTLFVLLFLPFMPARLMQSRDQ